MLGGGHVISTRRSRAYTAAYSITSAEDGNDEGCRDVDAGCGRELNVLNDGRKGVCLPTTLPSQLTSSKVMPNCDATREISDEKGRERGRERETDCRWI
jgi:hypothetical protein